MANSPSVTVLLPTLDSSRYLASAIDSILNQSWSDLSLVVLDGGSQDATLEIARDLADRDRRLEIRVFAGIHPARRFDEFIPEVKSRFIAIQHSDDVSHPHRIERQIRAFETDPRLGVCGTAYRSFGHELTPRERRRGASVQFAPSAHEEIRAQLPFWWVMHGASLMLDRERATGAGFRFANEFQFAGDYWRTVVHSDRLRYGNLPEELSAHRVNLEGDGAKNLDRLRQEEREVKGRALRHFGFRFDARELELHCAIRLLPDARLQVAKQEEYDEVVRWLKNLRVQNEALGAFDRRIFSAQIDDLVRQVGDLRAGRGIRFVRRTLHRSRTRWTAGWRRIHALLGK